MAAFCSHWVAGGRNRKAPTEAGAFLLDVAVDDLVGSLQLEVAHRSFRFQGRHLVPKQIAEEGGAVEFSPEVPGLAGAVESLHQARVEPANVRVFP